MRVVYQVGRAMLMCSLLGIAIVIPLAELAAGGRGGRRPPGRRALVQLDVAS